LTFDFNCAFDTGTDLAKDHLGKHVPLLSTCVPDLDPCVLGPSGSGSVIICTDPDLSINKQKNKTENTLISSV
jgi:hypothetical protein